MEIFTIVSSIEELIDDVNCQLPAFLIHIFNIRNQYSYLKFIRDNLAKHEILIQIDFSENYVLKYSTENSGNALWSIKEANFASYGSNALLSEDK